MMKKVSLFLVFFAALSFAIVSCGGEAPKAAEEDQATETVDETPTADQDVEEQQMDLTAGEEIYKTKCATCHQLNGEGMTTAFPPLAKADYLMEDIPRAIRQARQGSQGPITVNGTEYPGGIMAATPVEMTDQELLDVMNFVLNSWGNEHGMLTMDDITAAFAE